ncbi:MAG: hypothetical protein QNL61_01335 [Crocinitomicaceae bacterium]|jgi:hypothetical protein
MGTIAEQFESGAKKASKGHFNNLIMLARVDGKIDIEEKGLLGRIASRLSLTDDQVQEILDHPENYPMIPPSNKEERFERFIQFVQMMLVDGHVVPSEEKLIGKYGIALGFVESEIPVHEAKIVKHLNEGLTRHEVLDLFI